MHLGIDVFCEAGAPVYAPLDGTVHSVANNAATGDYGPTIILEHRVDDGAVRFFTLYGHLSAASLDGMSPGRRVAAGERIAWLGDAAVNGGWPPHLHLQIVADMLGREGEFPGVAAPSEREIWLSLCPDANLIAGVPADRMGPKPPAPAALLEERRRRLGPNLSLSYSRPITMARGYRQYLYDVDGRRFLDGVNNVPHVGHNHPRVVEAAARQLAVLNTNTRYLHESSVAYARRLCELMPPELSVCYLVCSGSEANELALRLARAYTGHTDFVVLDGAYHGNTSSLVEISPYKFNGPGGAGPAPHVHAVVMPDVYRGPYRADDPSAGARYAHEVARAIERAEAGGRHVAAFICESLLGCGGQIVLPDGYLERAYAAVRAAGGVAIADEVQVGFGRVGTRRLGIRHAGRRARHRDAREADRQRVPARRGRHAAGDRRRVRQRHGVLQHVRRNAGGVRGGPGRARRDARRAVAGPCAGGRRAAEARPRDADGRLPDRRRRAGPRPVPRRRTGARSRSRSSRPRPRRPTSSTGCGTAACCSARTARCTTC